ncbi:MAG TPA: hypothetical protein P5056_00785 [Candidatus Paceibacterota bacterium]|nr:hypothetical protein [Candidatus Paceibacterota bacterium]
MNDKTKMEGIIKKVEEMRKSGTVDLSLDEDLSIAIMNLISLEEHFFFTGEKTKDSSYFNMLAEVRETRKELLQKLMSKNDGESWCISKHLLAASMRLMEVGTKLQGSGKKDEAKEFFDRSYRMYSLFWALRLKIIDTAGLKEVAAGDKPWTVDDIVTKLVNCCDE